MSFENIDLSPYMLQNLYRKNLVSIAYKSKENVTITPVKYLGGNESNILILTNDMLHTYLNDDDLMLLTKILDACKLSLADVAIINVANVSEDQIAEICNSVSFEKIIMFGIDPAFMKLPFRIPNFQIQQHNSKTYITSPALRDLADNKEFKTQLWRSFQQLFLGR